MKRILFILTLLAFYKIQAQYESGTIYFKNGASKSGYIKFKNYGEIKFKKNKTEKSKVYGYNELKKMYVGGIYYEFLMINSKPRYLKSELKGKINLYSSKATRTDFNSGASFEYTVYYINKEGKTVITTNKFKKKYDFLIKDCPGLYKVVKNKEINRNELKMIVEYYNIYCKKN